MSWQDSAKVEDGKNEIFSHHFYLYAQSKSNIVKITLDYLGRDRDAKEKGQLQDGWRDMGIREKIRDLMFFPR